MIEARQALVPDREAELQRLGWAGTFPTLAGAAYRRGVAIGLVKVYMNIKSAPTGAALV